MPLGFTDLDPRRRFGAARLAAGAFSGAMGGLAFGLVMTYQLVGGGPLHEGSVARLIGALLGTQNSIAVWGVHLVAASVFGLLFSLVIAPSRARHTIPFAIVYGLGLWFFGAWLVLRTLTGTPLAFDGAVMGDLFGHLVYGLALGAVYVAFFHAEDDQKHERRTATLSPPSTLR